MKLINIKKYFIISSTLLLTTFSAHTTANLSPKNVLNKAHKAQTNKAIKNFKQNRTAKGYIYASENKLIGNTQETFKVTVGPHNTQMSSVTGNIHFAFDPTQAACTRGLHLTYSIGASTPISISPSCDNLLHKELNYDWSHTIASPEVTLPEVPLDSLGIFRVGAKVGGAFNVGANFRAGLKIGGFEKNNDPIYQQGVRQPDVIYATASPWISGSVTGKAYAAVDFLGMKRIEKGVKGRLNLINMSTEGHIEGGITYKPGAASLLNTNENPYQYYTKLKWTGSAKGGDGDISLYCDVKLFNVWNIFSRSTKVISWKPIYETQKTFYEKSHYF